MASYKIIFKKSAVKELSDIPKKDLSRIIKRIQSLADNPRPAGSEKLAAQECYRIRQGNYRAIYIIDDVNLTIDIFKIGHRCEVYRF
ncbi:MAG: type II toxin-antitoxin system RelE/ParE family toxin [Planctomycetota bacterium]